MQCSSSLARSQRQTTVWILGAAVLLLAAGLAWLALASQSATPTASPAPAAVADLTPGVAATMDSPPFTYSPGWQVTADGADPTEPAAPFEEPAGVLDFVYRGRDLLLAIAPGDYWAYLFVSVDGAPANQLPAIPGNTDSRGEAAGYKPLYEPGSAVGGSAEVRWLLVHRAAGDGPHAVRVETWRGLTPIFGARLISCARA